MMGVFRILCVCVVFATFSAIHGINTSKLEPLKNIDDSIEEAVEESHKLDSLNIFAFICLLILTVLTVWGFKHYRLRFIHETGLAIMYGLIIGAIIRYAAADIPVQYLTLPIPEDNQRSEDNMPLNIKLQLINYTTNSSYYYTYTFKERSRSPKKKGELSEKATFDPEIFFNIMLPAIIFHAGYSLKRKHFFRNFGAIMTYALAGTLVSFFVVGGIVYGFTRLMPIVSTKMGITDCLFFGALISATDPVTVLAIFHDLNVDVDLYACIFGESVLNDAVAIVLARTVEQFGKNVNVGGEFDYMAILRAIGNFLGIFFGSFAIGSFIGCLTAILTKYTKISEYPLLETSLFFLMSYGSFLAAESAGLTGIVAVLFCGICQAHYTYNNLSTESKARTRQVFELLNFLSENFVFTYIGVSTFTFQKHQWEPGFIFTGIFAIIVARAVNIYPLSFLINLGRRRNKITMNMQHMMMFSGLRGAIAFALSIRNTASETRQIIFTTTLIIVISTVILCGGFTTQMLQWLKIRVGVEDDTEPQNFQAVRTVSGTIVHSGMRAYMCLFVQEYGAACIYTLVTIVFFMLELTPEAIAKQKKYSTMTESGQVDPDNHDNNQNSAPDQPQPSEVRAHSTNYEKASIVVRGWYYFDTRFMKPLLTHSRPLLTETCPLCCYRLALLLTTEKQMSQDSHGSDSDDTDFILDENELVYGEPSPNTTPATTPTVEEPERAFGETVVSVETMDGDLGLGITHPVPIRTQLKIPGAQGDAV